MSKLDQAPVVTVVVTTRNSAPTLEACLASVRGQSHPALELVVADNGSTDGTVAIAERFADRVLQVGPERSAQRNAAVSAGTGSYVLILDSDMVLAPEVIAECVAAHREGGATAVVIPEQSFGTGFLARAKALERRCYLGDDTVEAPRFFTRATFDAYGGYDERLTGPEDWDLPARMRGREPFGRVDAMIYHDEGQLRLLPLLRKKFYYGKSSYRYVRRHPSLARRQMLPVRAAFVRNRSLLAKQPTLAAGMLAMKLAELTAAGLGALAGVVAGRASR